MTAETLTMVSGVVLSLLASYVPGFKDWFAGLESIYKRLLMLGAVLLAAAGVFGLACMGRLDAVACDGDGAWALVELFILAAIANQATYTVTK